MNYKGNMINQNDFKRKSSFSKRNYYTTSTEEHYCILMNLPEICE